MGVERAVTRWYLQRVTLMNAVEALETQVEQAALAHQQQAGQEPVGEASQAETKLVQQLTEARKQLRLLGPCPAPKMG
jgi:hypothetical protein